MERRHIEQNQANITIKRAEGEPSVISGYAAVFYRVNDPKTEFRLWDNIYERIAPQAFTRALNEKHDARGLFNHDMNHVLGRVGANTLSLSVDEIGLRYEIRIPETQLARDLMTSIERGDISGSSFAFVPTKVTWTDEQERTTRTIEDVDLFDVGPVTFPAYEGTSTGVRSSERGSIEKEYEDWREQIKRERGAIDAVSVRARQIELDSLNA